jgi:hypothetical protein
MAMDNDLIEELLAAESLRRLNAAGTVPVSAPGPPPDMDRDTHEVWAACEQRLFESGVGAKLIPWQPKGCEMCAAVKTNCSQTSTVSFYPKDTSFKEPGLWLSDSSTHRRHWEVAPLVELAENQHVLAVLEKYCGIEGVKTSLQAASIAAGERVRAGSKPTVTPATEASGGVQWGKIS